MLDEGLYAYVWTNGWTNNNVFPDLDDNVVLRPGKLQLARWVALIFMENNF